MSRLRAGVIGVGRMGVHHARLYATMPETTLAAICNDTPAGLAHGMERLNSMGYLDFREMLAKERLDLVSIATPTRSHYAIAREAIAAGVHVLIEKPIAYTVEEAQALIDLARQHQVVLMVGHIERFNPAVIEAKRRLDQQELGAISFIHAQRFGAYPDRAPDTGVILDLVLHDIDIASMMVQADITQLSAQTQTRATPDLEDAALTRLVFNSGVHAQLEASRLESTRVRRLAVSGQHGRCVVDYLTQELFWDKKQIDVQKTEPLLAELQAFVKAISNGEPPITGQDGLQALKIARALIDVSQNNDQLTLSDPIGETAPHAENLLS